jgi:hypothetical protein
MSRTQADGLTACSSGGARSVPVLVLLVLLLVVPVVVVR